LCASVVLLFLWSEEKHDLLNRTRNKPIRVKNSPSVPERLRGKEGVLWEMVSRNGKDTAFIEINGQVERLPHTDIEVTE
jgi:hypothetical protein